MANIYRYIPLDSNTALSVSGYLLVEYSLPKQCEALRVFFCCCCCCFVFFSFCTTGVICFCTEPEEARNLQSKGKIPEEHALECLPKVEKSLDSWLHFEEVVLKCRERADFPPCVQKDKLKQMIDEDETFEGMLDFYHNRGLIILPGNSLYFHSAKHCFGNLCFVL